MTLAVCQHHPQFHVTEFAGTWFSNAEVSGEATHIRLHVRIGVGGAHSGSPQGCLVMNGGVLIAVLVEGRARP